MTYSLELMPQPVTPESWEPYGWLPVSDEDPKDGERTLTFVWQDAHVNFIHHSTEELEHMNGDLVCDRMFRHWTHTQTLHVLNADSILAVAPPGSTFAGPEDLKQIEAFLLHPGDTLVLHRSTWHWGPFPVRADRVDMLNIQGRRYNEDNECQLLRGLGTVVCRAAG